MISSDGDQIIQLLQKSARMEATQEHIVSEMQDIKDLLYEIKQDNQAQNTRIEKLELHNAAATGSKNITTGILSFVVATVTAVITALVMRWIGGV